MTRVAPLVALVVASLLGRAAAGASILCAWTKVLHNGDEHRSFMRQDPLSLRLYHSVWSEGRTLLRCAWSDDASVLRNYASLCRERTREFSDGHSNRSFDLKAERQCVRLASPGVAAHGGRTGKRPARSVDGMNGQGQGERSEVNIHRRVKRGFIVPGTLWCGSGNKAPSYEDLGVFANTDSCCREHDQCKHTILSFHSEFGVFNTNIFTMSHCECDDKFRHCLMEANDSISHAVGYTFFNLLKMHCFEFSHRLQCTQRNWFGLCKESKMALYAEVHPPTLFQDPSPTEVSINSSSSVSNSTISAQLQGSSISEPTNFFVPVPTTSTGTDSSTVPNPLTSTDSSTLLNPSTGTDSSTVPNPSTGTNSSIVLNPSTGTDSSMVPNPLTSTDSSTLLNPSTGTDSSTVPNPSTGTNSSIVLNPSTGTDSSTVPNPSTGTNSSTVPNPSTGTNPSTVPNPSTSSPTASIIIDFSTVPTPSTSLPSTSVIADSSTVPNLLTNSPPTSFAAVINVTISIVPGSTDNVENSLPTKVRPQEQDADLTAKLQACDVYKDLDKCRNKIPPHENRFGLHNPEPRTLYHCNCTSRLFQTVAEQMRPTEVQALLLEHVSRSCFLPQDCSAGKTCTAVLLKADIPGAEVGGQRLLQTVSLKVRRPKRKDGAVRLHRRCIRMVRRQLNHSRRRPV